MYSQRHHRSIFEPSAMPDGIALLYPLHQKGSANYKDTNNTPVDFAKTKRAILLRYMTWFFPHNKRIRMLIKAMVINNHPSIILKPTY